MAADNGDTVRVHYTGTLQDGEEFDSSRDREPLEFTLGEGQVVPGFENIVTGMDEGQTKTETVGPDEAYGPRMDQRLIEVSKDQLPDDLDPTIGDQLQIQPPGQQPIQVRISEIEDETVTLDGNHPLAGRELTFEVELLEIV